MRKFEYSSKDFKKTDSAKCKLAIQYSRSEYGFTIYHTSLKKFVHIRFKPFENEWNTEEKKLTQLFNNEELLKLNYASVAFLYYSPKATLVPEELYTEQTQNQLFAYNHFLSETELVLSNKIEHSSIVNIFSFPKNLKTFLDTKIKNYKIFHQYTSFVESALLSNAQNAKNKEVYINVDNHLFNICVVQNKELHFNNSFEYQSIDDFIYYIHLTLKNLNIADANIPFILSGNISSKVGTYKILSRYFKNLKFKDSFPKAAFSKDLTLDKHYFDNLIYITV